MSKDIKSQRKWGPTLLTAAALAAGCSGIGEPMPPTEEHKATGGAQPEPQAYHMLQATTTAFDFANLERRAWCGGEVCDDNDEWWSFAMSIGGDAQGRVRAGAFMLSNAGTFAPDGSHSKIMTLFGKVKTGTITWKPTGGGYGMIEGTLTTGKAITIWFSDVNRVDAKDTFRFKTGSLSYSGTVRCGKVRIHRALPASLGRTTDTRFKFDPQIGLYIPVADLALLKNRDDDPMPDKVLEVVHPDPVIDFRKDDPGGYVLPPGSANNVP